MKKIIAFTIFTMLLGSIHAQQLRFYQEDLNFTINKTHFTLSGMYYLHNYGADTSATLIQYPFHYLMEQIDSISILNCQTNEACKISYGKKSAYFKAVIPPGEKYIYHIYYTQKLPKDSVTYILTTTQAWRAGFTKASYKLKTDEGANIDSTSMAVADTVWSNNSSKYYKWSKKDFLPTFDFTIWYSDL